MRHIVAAFIVSIVLLLATRSADVNGQASCIFVGGFARLREMVGAEKVGACVDDEHLSSESGNVEQRTTGGLLVWRQADNVTAFTDGGVTWLNGPRGLESRPNGERFPWELDPVVSVGPSSVSPPPPPPPPLPDTPPPPPPPSPEALPPSPVPSPVPVSTGPGAPASAASAPQTSAAVTSPAAVSAPAPVATPTRTPTPKPAVTVTFTEKPDDVDTGGDAHFEVQTSAKKGTCSLVVTYRNTSDAAVGAKDIDDDGRCEWRYTLATTTKTGKAKAVVTVTANGGSASVEDNFEVKKGDTIYAGSVDLEVDLTDLPDDVNPGAEIKIGVDTNLKRKGSCDLTITWPKVGPIAGEAQMPDDRGRCSWKITVPPGAPTNSTASLIVTVRKDASTVRTLTKDFKVAK